MPRVTTQLASVDRDLVVADDVEDRMFRARTKLRALYHLLSQYRGESEFSDESAHGLAMILDDIGDQLQYEVPRQKGGA